MQQRTTESEHDDVIKADLRQPQPILKQRALGFFAFVACALMAVLFSTERNTGAASPISNVVLATSLPASNTLSEGIAVAGISTDSPEKLQLAEVRVMQGAESKRDSAGVDASVGSLVFESRSFVTSEKAVAAVFIVARTQSVGGRAVVWWAALSGSADAGIDFSDASGTARFADGQRQLAIYVPLRNDLLRENDETFKVCLRSARYARLDGGACAEATIRDDDNSSPI